MTFFALIVVSSYSLHVVDSYMCATYEQMKWNQDGNHTFEDRTDVYNKVRLDNLNYIINDLENEIVK